MVPAIRLSTLKQKVWRKGKEKAKKLCLGQSSFHLCRHRFTHLNLLLRISLVWPSLQISPATIMFSCWLQRMSCSVKESPLHIISTYRWQMREEFRLVQLEFSVGIKYIKAGRTKQKQPVLYRHLFISWRQLFVNQCLSGRLYDTPHVHCWHRKAKEKPFGSPQIQVNKSRPAIRRH